MGSRRVGIEPFGVNWVAGKTGEQG